MSKGILQVHPPICDCPGCRISSPVNRGRLAEKRTIPLPPNRVPKKELASIFSSDDSEGSERASGDHAHIKQEDELHYSIMRKSRDSDLSTIISNLHHTRQHGMPEGQSASDLSTGSGHSGRKCWMKLLINVTLVPSENSQSPEVEAGGSHMSPEEHYRRMMSALSEPGSYEEQQQRLYQLASSMGLQGHGQYRHPTTQSHSPGHSHLVEALAAAVRNPQALEAHLPSAGSSSSSSSQRRKQGLPQHRDAHYTDREMSHPPPLLSPPTAPHIALGPHLRPPFLGMPSALCQAPGYSFLQPAQAEIFARQQELLRKQNLARCVLEMSAELLRQKELENLHQRQQQQQQQQQRLLEGHPLREELARRSNAMLVLRHGAATPLLALNHQQQQQQPAAASTPKESQAQSSGAAADADSRRAARRALQMQLRPGDHRGPREDRGREADLEPHDDDMKDSDSEEESCEERRDGVAATPGSKPRHAERGKDTGNNRACDGAKELFTPGLGKTDLKYLPPGFIPPVRVIDTSFSPAAALPGSLGGLFMDGEDSATANPVEDISKWSVEDVCGFISSLAGCAEYTQVFREQAIDGETLPLLTEEHLLTTMGLKLGPALKIRSQVARRVGRLFYMTGFPLAFPFAPSAAALRPAERDRDPLATPSDAPLSSSSPYSGPTPGCSSPKQENGSTAAARYEAKTPS
uniref:Sterile alpha motif domain containing 11 n=1 Tax=Salarias fasciatus TaxID=181472 RepID=A0A672FUE8_SALFA